MLMWTDRRGFIRMRRVTKRMLRERDGEVLEYIVSGGGVRYLLRLLVL